MSSEAGAGKKITGAAPKEGAPSVAQGNRNTPPPSPPKLKLNFYVG